MKASDDSHSTSISEVQLSFMAKLEVSAETENRLKLDLKSMTSQLSQMTSERESERGELEGRLGELVQEKRQLTDIMREKIEEGKRLQAQVR